ncbi:MAG: hypothetical protein QOJ53_120 [Sphingomonadales bacterium]|jgi:hypothetical protein|nr:hypothetical protein [Sphingomonadales bacterium]MEA3044490.1 hypothetical protein [Sphingomonadales bacterium]MEA3045788.1 hypothetical protein [Sphingomonadales bacterium]
MLNKLWGLTYRVLHLVALAFLIFAFAQALPFDLAAIVFAGDALVYLEIATALWLAAQVTRVRWVAAYARFVVRRTVRRARLRARRAARRVRRIGPSSSSDDRPAPAFAYA